MMSHHQQADEELPEDLEEQALVRGANLKLAARHKRIVAGQFQGLKTWIPEVASPGVTTRVLVSFSISAILEVGDRLVLQLPPTHRWRIPKQPNVSVQAPEGIPVPKLDACWQVEVHTLEFVVLESFLPPLIPLVLVLAGITTPECATPQEELMATSFKKTVLRDTVPTTTRGGQIVDGPTAFVMAKILPGLITGICKWTPFNCFPGLVSDVALSFCTSGGMEKHSIILMQLPADENWQIDANPRVSLRTSTLDGVAIEANWNEPQKTIEFFLQELSLPMRTPLVLTIYNVRNPSTNPDNSVGCLTTGRVTTLLITGGVIDGPGRIEIARISDLREKDFELAANSFDEHDVAKSGSIELDNVTNVLQRCGIKLSSTLYSKLVLGHLKTHQDDDKTRVRKVDFLNLFAIVYAPAFKFGQTMRVHCGRGEHDQVLDLLARGCDVNAKDGSGWTCLHYAADFGRLETLNLLVETCGDQLQLNATDTSGWTPLMCAAANGHAEVVKRLLEQHADLNVVSKAGRSALHWACSRGKLDVIKVLIEHGAIVDQMDHNKWTPLHCAYLHGCVDAATLLLENGASSISRDILDLSPLEYRQVLHPEEPSLPSVPSTSQTTRRKEHLIEHSPAEVQQTS